MSEPRELDTEDTSWIVSIDDLPASPSTPAIMPAQLAELRVTEAHRAHARGWAVTPLRGKKPTLKSWTTRTRPAEHDVTRWARAGNVGIRTGKISGLLVVDVDAAKGGVLEGLPETPTVCTGGGGLHHYFAAPDPCPGSSVGRLAPHVDTRGEGGQAVAVGSVHPETGNPYLWAEGLSPDDVPLAPFPVELLDRLVPEPRPAPSAEPAHTNGDAGRYGDVALERELAKVRSAPEGQRNATLNAAAFSLGQLVAGGTLERSRVEHELAAAGREIGLEEKEIAATIRSGLRKGAEKPRGPEPRRTSRAASSSTTSTPAAEAAAAEHDPRPEIVLGTEIAPMVDALQVALLARPDLGIYQRAGLLMRITRDGAPRVLGFQRPEGAAVIAEAPEEWVFEQASRAARWSRLDGRSGELRACQPSKTAVRVLRAREAWTFPYLEGLIAAPTLRPDGTILDRPGYDPSTGLLLQCAADACRRIPEHPTRDDAGEALAVLAEPFADFRFVSLADQSVILAAVLSVLGRHAIAGPVPLTAAVAPTPGSGKSLMADVVGIIATGHPPARMTAPREDDEMRKRLLAIGLEAAPLVLLDNVTGILRSDSLASALTSERTTDRVLGSNRTQTVPMRSVWLVTGNNLSFGGDLGRRVQLCGIDPRMEHPEDRTDFAHPDLKAYVRGKRAELIAAGLTVLRAFHLAGRPAHGKPLKGSFEEWDRLVRAALIWAGAPDPVVTSERIRAEGDADLDTLREALREWEAAFGDEPRTASEAVERSRKIVTLGTALAELAGVPVAQLDARSLGYRLRGSAGRIVDGLCFERGSASRAAEGTCFSRTRREGVQWRVRGAEK